MKETAAAARRVNRALVARQCDDEYLEQLTQQLNTIADNLEGGEPRNKLDDLLSRPYLDKIYSGIPAPIPVEDGDEIEFDPFTMGGGHLNPSSVGVTFRRESDNSVVADCTIDSMFSGPPGRTHGGVVALIADETMGALNRMHGRHAITAYLNVTYRAPTPIGVPIQFRAWVHKTEGRKATLRVTAHSSETLCLEAEALFIEPKDGLMGVLNV